MGQPVAFPLASSSVRPDDRPGDLVADDPDSLRALPPLVGVMRVGRKAKAERVPVRLAARVTEVGTVELWCQSRTDDRRWRLQIQLRGPAAPEGSGTAAGRAALAASIAGPGLDQVVIEQSELDAAIEAITTAFNASANDEAARAVAVDQTARRDPRRAPRPMAPLSPAALLGAAARPGRTAAQEPAARVALAEPGGLRPPARHRLPARRGADQGALAGLSPGCEARQGRAVLDRVVGPLATRLGGAGTAAP